MLDENMTIKTPPVESDVLEYLREQAELWKNSERREKTLITHEVKKKYPLGSVEYEYFQAFKETKILKPKVERKKDTNNAYTSESKERKEFSECLKKYLKKYLYTRNGYDETEGLFVVDRNYNLPSYFWMRLNLNVLPSWSERGIKERHAWILAKKVCEKYEDELISRLQNTDFHDLKHLSNSIIQFLEKYMLTTYIEIKKQAQENLIRKAREEELQKSNNVIIEENNNDKQKTIKRSGLRKRRKMVKF